MGKTRKKYEELTIIDDFMFGKVMRNPERCKKLLEIILDMKIRKVTFINDQKAVNPDYRAKSVDSLVPQDAFTGELEEAVAAAREHKEWRQEYMKLELMMMDSRREGRREGKIEGKIEERIDLVCRKLARGKTPEEIAEDLGIDLSEVRRICGAAVKHAPDYDTEKILEELLADR